MSKQVSIGCKLPNGITLQLFKPVGDKATKIVTHSVTLKGANATRIVGGYGITPVDSDLWAEWLKHNSDHPAINNGSLFMVKDETSARSEASNRRDVKTGLEQIDPVKNGMLKGPDGENDKKALRDYEQAKRENPRNMRAQAE